MIKKTLSVYDTIENSWFQRIKQCFTCKHYNEIWYLASKANQYTLYITNGCKNLPWCVAKDASRTGIFCATRAYCYTDTENHFDFNNNERNLLIMHFFCCKLVLYENVHTVDDLCIYTSGLIHTLKFGGINYHIEPWSDSPQLFLWCHLILFIKKNFFIESKLLHDLPAKNYKSCKQNRGFRGFDQMFN